MSQETNEFENGPVGEADSDSLQTPHSPESNPTESSTSTTTASTTATSVAENEIPFEEFKPQSGEEASSDQTAQVPPAPVVGPRRLVRDPYSRLGGVASGVAHYYGVDVVLVRLLFIAFVLFTGVGLLLYFLAWLLIPRAEYWPPTPPKGGTRAGLDNRQIALGLVGFGVLVAAFASGGSASQVLIALGLIGAGVWMFTQNPEPQGQLATPGSTPDPTPNPTANPTMAPPTDGIAGDGGDDDPYVSAFSGAGSPPVTPPPVGGDPVGYPAPQPVPRRRRRIWPFIVFPLIFIGLPLLFLAGLLVAAVVGDGLVEIDGDDIDDRLVEVTTVDELLEPIDHGIGSVTVDLSELEADDFADYDTPVDVKISSDVGEIKVVLPEDLDVRVVADLDLGDISVLGRSAEGISPSLNVGNGEPVVEFDLDLDLGLIEVSRVGD